MFRGALRRCFFGGSKHKGGSLDGLGAIWYSSLFIGRVLRSPIYCLAEN